ncbi:MAG TPA: hypothetical protein VL381_08760 [Rhodocyclaceae bacterium]|jgi:hypothetical protein|nr:hypothetical protein [Rhodocyclaceae bacterium]
MLKKFILLFLMLASFSVMAEKKVPKPKPILEADGPTIGYKTVAEALAAVSNDPAAHFVGELGWKVYSIGGPGQPTYILWNFSLADHPAHPTAIKRTLYEKDGQLVIDMDVACEARKTTTCEKIVREFMAVNDNMRRYYQQIPQDQPKPQQ